MVFNEDHRFILTLTILVLTTITLLFGKMSLDVYLTFITGFITGVINPTTLIKERLIQ